MPKKYTAMPEDIMLFSGAATVYSMIKPVEDKLKAAGWISTSLSLTRTSVSSIQRSLPAS